ncbi:MULTISPECIES: efflux RND transporter permease subunit [Idiomarina]|uniref:efflux RND transporter permease subunit n=1 Tax=Idiomarina TaxID=135575 RepID=UPI00129B212B|nr:MULTISPECIES: efflux RND transporter permease subunit [Idiomarina]MRJ41652.1 MMPL family transporter [Idiomarina sp. FeN1]NCU57642.1 MMPL family transporter [Idiomarina sp. FenA--70]NCU60194.1 MMPL family transporter [Idiomarina sp. FenBw--71]UUN13457.1 efflux RND transporter permease subunit [Idiomarina loihiensis]
MSNKPLGIAGKFAAWGERSQLTPLLALFGLILGIMAAMITPREEEPQIDVTMADIMIAFPGADVSQVEQQLTTPLERHFARMQGIEHIFSVSQPGQALVTVQFEVGIARDTALVQLFDTLAGWQQQHPQFTQPLVKARGIDDVPILGLTLTGADLELKDVADSLIEPLQNVAGVRDISIIGAEPEQINVTLDNTALTRVGLDFNAVSQALASQNQSGQAGYRLQGNQYIPVQVGGFIESAEALSNLIVANVDGKPVRLHQVAEISTQAEVPSQYVWSRQKGGELAPAITLAITKKAGENAVVVAEQVLARLATMQQQLLPEQLQVEVTRNYGQTADDKASKLIQKLIFATISVVALVLLTLGKREAVVVGSAVVLTLAMTLFASWAWGFTLNRVSLFALIFSIGILVDDAIVVVENIHRHLGLGKSLKTSIPAAVDEVGGPTILATFTVIAALLPMAFVSGLMGPYMSPIPINASLGMLLSLLIALTVTPWLARHLLKDEHHQEQQSDKLHRFFHKLMLPLLTHRKRRYLMGFGLIGLIVAMLGLAVVQAVVMKMLPFDNKSEIKLVLDMPEGSTLEQTNAVLVELAQTLDSVDEVAATQIYAGTASPIGFNGLVRQYYLRQGANMGDVQVTLKELGERERASHELALAIRPLLTPIAEAVGASLKIVEVPPGPPVMAPIVAEIYGPSAQARADAAQLTLAQLQQTEGVVDIDSTLVSDSLEEVWQVNRERAAQLGVTAEQVVRVLQTALAGMDVTYLAIPHQTQPVAVKVRLPNTWQGQLSQLQNVTVLSQTSGQAIPVAELIDRVQRPYAQPIYHKDLRPVVYVTADMAGDLDSPLYGLFAAAGDIELPQTYISQPDVWNTAALKWDGEWQITYETFRDMGAAYAVGLLLIYLLVVGHFGSYAVPLVIMAPIPLTLIGIMPGHALLGAQFTATSMIGMIALAGIIVRNSILLVDFVREEVAAGKDLNEAVIEAAAVRAKPIVLTALAAMLGAFFILDDPIFSGLAVSLIFGIAVSTALTLVVIPLLYASLLRRKAKHL